MILGMLGEGVGFMHQATDACPQGAKPTLDVAGLALGLGAAAMGAPGESGGVGCAEVAVGGVLAGCLGQADVPVRRALPAPVAWRPAFSQRLQGQTPATFSAVLHEELNADGS